MRARKSYIVFAAMFAAAALFHLIGALGLAFYVSPQWRHALWAAIDGGMTYAMLRPPSWVIAPLAAITLWSFYSHGWLVFRIWRATGQIDWLSLCVIVVLPLILLRLICDNRNPTSFAVR